MAGTDLDARAASGKRGRGPDAEVAGRGRRRGLHFRFGLTTCN
jgi:hypothetical protein